MRLGYFAMPMHPAGRSWRDTLDEDRQAIILAEQLGFHDAFIGEHLSDRYENITNSIVFLASLVNDTSTIRLGTGTSNLSYMHPAHIAANVAMLDHMSGGRLILGISAGSLPSDAELLGLLDEDRAAMFTESIDTIVRLWSEEAPYDIGRANRHFRTTTLRTFDADLGLGTVRGPLQQPRPEIVGTVVAPFSAGAVAMGQKDFHPLSANFLLPQWLRSHWDNYTKGAAEAGRDVDPGDWRVARTVFVADDDATALEYGRRSADSPYRFYYAQMLAKMARSGRLGLFKTRRDQPDHEVNLESVLDALVICGTPAQVAEDILALREATGDFGELVYAGIDWADPVLGRRSQELMATKVMPAVNAAIGR